MLNAYLCIYAAMYDAYAKIDGGGAGRDAGDDLRIEETEWMAGYKNVEGYNFVGLSLKDDDEAKATFKRMDHNGGGVVLLDEW